MADAMAASKEDGKLGNLETILEEEGFKVMREPREDFTIINATKIKQ